MSHEFVITRPDLRFVLVHYHLFKNAGTTVESILEREFPERFATLHGSHPDSVLDGRQLAAFLREHPEISAVSSHHLRYPLPLSRRTILFDCFFLRHPLARIHSFYGHYRRLNSSDSLSRMANEKTSKSFVKWLVGHAPNMVSDVQVQQLANAGVFRRPADRDDLDRAVKVVRQMSMPGLGERFDESLVVAEYFLRPAFPTLSLEYIARNVSDPAGQELSTQGERLKSMWGEDLYQELVRLNRLDLELHAAASQEIDRRFSLVPDSAQRLADLKSRCRNLSDNYYMAASTETTLEAS
jgi:hypothetical protein